MFAEQNCSASMCRCSRQVVPSHKVAIGLRAAQNKKQLSLVFLQENDLNIAQQQTFRIGDTHIIESHSLVPSRPVAKNANFAEATQHLNNVTLRSLCPRAQAVLGVLHPALAFLQRQAHSERRASECSVGRAGKGGHGVTQSNTPTYWPYAFSTLQQHHVAL